MGRSGQREAEEARKAQATSGTKAWKEKSRAGGSIQLEPKTERGED